MDQKSRRVVLTKTCKTTNNINALHEKIENQVFIQSLKARCIQHNVKIYALGVESKDEWRTLVHLGVTGGQGHFFTEPVAQMADAIVLP